MILSSWRGDPHNSHAVRGEDPMYRHMLTCLEGPVSHNRLHRLFAVLPEAKPDAAVRTKEVRRDLVERIRREIAAGTYETSEKWQAALDRLAEQL
jgi:Anti-sigma-28 factor, FlgM